MTCNHMNFKSCTEQLNPLAAFYYAMDHPSLAGWHILNVLYRVAYIGWHGVNNGMRMETTAVKNNQLIKTNLLISIVLIVGFSMTAFFSYRANYQATLNNIEQVASLTGEGIHYQLTTLLTKPVNISLTMAHDSLLVEQLSCETENLENREYVQRLQTYLQTYRDKYGFDSVFLVSSATRRYYNFNGIDRVLAEDDPENGWYFDLMDSGLGYSMNVDNDEVDGSDDAITVFVNCKVADSSGNILGIVGVGIRISYLKEFLEGYEDKYNMNICLVNEDGIIEVSTTYTGYSKTDWFEVHGQEGIRDEIMGFKEDTENLGFWTDNSLDQGKSFVVTRYIPDLSWHLVIDQDSEDTVHVIRDRLYQTILGIAVIISIVLFIITTVIRNFNKQITKLMEERENAFQQATEQLYDNIYELNITRNCTGNQRTAQYFESLGAQGLPYDQALRVIAQKQIKKEFRQGYISTFTPENVIREYENGNSHLKYDFMITQDGSGYFWMRIDAYIFFSHEDNCLHMFTYRKNIDEEKKKELLAYIDEMTRFLTKAATKRKVTALLTEEPEKAYAFFIFDIDNFKQANDCFGHAFGDYCIREFTRIIREHFREGDVLGRIGGDEFVAFIPIPCADWVRKKAAELSHALDTECTRDGKTWKMSASIGISVASKEDRDFDTLYEKADQALYRTKQKGKNGYTVDS